MLDHPNCRSTFPFDVRSIREFQREEIVQQVAAIVDNLSPGQRIEVEAHDPNDSYDRRHFTVHFKSSV